MQQLITRRELTSILTLIAITFLALASSSNPPNGRTGAPGDGLCSDCHSQNNPPQDGTLAIEGFPSSIVPNTNYTLTVTISNPNGLAERAGFQMVILNSNNQNSGALSNPSSSSVVTPSGGRDYHEHNPAKNFGAGTEVSWTVDWTSPSGPDMEAVTAYAAGIVANGAGGSSGDLLVTSTEDGSLTGSALSIEIVSEPVTCFGGSDGTAAVSVSGGSPDYSYLWSTGATVQTLSGLTAGVYSVTVTDAQGSTADGSVEVVEPTELMVTVPVASPPSCSGDTDGSITAEGVGGTPGYTYLWSDGSTGDVNGDLGGGDYSVTITDANGCTASVSTTLTEPDPLVLELVGAIDPACAGEATGVIEVIADGGTVPYTYIWSNGASGPAAGNLPAGTYSVLVSDLNGCSIENTYVLIDPPGIEIEDVSITGPTCHGGSDGSIGIEASGPGALTYEWSSGQTGSMITDLDAGTYEVTITDENGCTVDVSYTVVEPGEISISFGGDMSVSCNGDSDADVTVSAEGGTPPYLFSWPDDGDGTGLSAGTYTVTVTDANVCNATDQVVITQPEQLTANASVTDETALNANDGTAMSEPQGGIGPYTYLWSSGASTDSISGLSPGDYTVTVTDANACTAFQTVTVNAFGCSLTIQTESVGVTCFGGDDGSAGVSWTDANGAVIVNWSTGDTTEVVSGLSPGSYSVTVTDTSGCAAQDNIVITEPDALTFDLLFDTLVCPGEEVTVAVEPQTFDQYQWSDGQTGQSIVVLPGEYCVTVTNQDGCAADTCFIIGVSPPILVTIDTVLDASTGMDNGAIGITAEGGTGPLSFIWRDLDGNTISTEEDPVGLAPGDYFVEVVDALGCAELSDTVTVGVISALYDAKAAIHVVLTPNPASNYITLTMDDPSRIREIIVFSASGQSHLVLGDSASGRKIDVSTLPEGLYYLALRTDLGVAVAKFMKF